jgi:hypothetical protein
MKRFFIMLPVVASMFLVACASHANKTAGGMAGPARVTASGYTKEGCLLNLKLTARERNVRLVPDDLQVEANLLMFVFPFLNHEGYQCSGSFTEKQPLKKDPLYPFD